MNPIIAPSILAADFGRLANSIELINQSEAEWIHIDVMDGHFVPNISFGVPVMEAIQKHSEKFLDVHLMISNPDNFIDVFNDLGAKNITVHFETCTHLHKTIQEIKSKNILAGVALNPHTPVNVLSEIVNDCDLVCIMSVNPGFGGQKFIPSTFRKIASLKSMLAEKQAQVHIQVDGGVGPSNSQALVNAGATILVAGSAVFHSENPADTIRKMKQVQHHNIQV